MLILLEDPVLVLFHLLMSYNVRFEVAGLYKLRGTALDGTDEELLPSVDAHMGAEVKIQGEALPTACKGALEGPLTCVHQEVAGQLAALIEGAPTLCTHEASGRMQHKVLPQGGFIPQPLCASNVRTRECLWSALVFILRELLISKFSELLRTCRSVSGAPPAGDFLLAMYLESQRCASSSAHLSGRGFCFASSFMYPKEHSLRFSKDLRRKASFRLGSEN